MDELEFIVLGGSQTQKHFNSVISVDVSSLTVLMLIVWTNAI